ncbi:hypothetical protein [Marinilabilia rubra]|uniref:Uncharacterized protein n=1 Tax=Marinilabilia rubra TaxID=2162893 RepID=A0A2U2BAB3_9BACT|nr:hypothetical protein [Marinilabilia rubra]PWE00006.1 hypothetical protein DDZ16_06480 [Marinilabilia rubra]
MKTFYVNKQAQANGDHEVHREDCIFLPSIENRQYLGVFNSCYEAVKEARKSYPKANGCFYCSRDCHTS